MAEIIDFSKYRKSQKEKEIESLRRKLLSEYDSDGTPDDALFESLIEQDICPCCGKYFRDNN